jgi:hypothetical protein
MFLVDRILTWAVVKWATRGKKKEVTFDLIVPFPLATSAPASEAPSADSSGPAPADERPSQKSSSSRNP